MTPDDEPDVEALLDETFAGRYQARLGEVIDVLELPGFVAHDGGRLVGVAMYRVDGDTAELAATAGTSARLARCSPGRRAAAIVRCMTTSRSWSWLPPAA